MERSLPPGEAMPAGSQRQSGFTYLGLLAAVVILGLVLTMASRVWSFSAQRDKEVELLHIGAEYRLAIARFYAVGSRYPSTLQDLLTDNRFPVPRRHLRQLYRDPFTGDTDWTLIMDPTNSVIMGVASKSKLVPIKRKGFGELDVGFDDKDCYSDWKFVFVPTRKWRQPYAVPGIIIPGSSGAAPGAPIPSAPGQNLITNTPGQ